MAEVPYGGGVPTVAPDTRPPDDYQHVQAKPEQFGGLIARGAEAAGQGALKAGQFFGQVVTDDQLNNIQESASHLLHGDPNKTGPDGKQDTGYFGLEGDAALKARPGIEKQLDDLVTQARGNLSTPEQQLQFDNMSRRWRVGLGEKIGTYADQQSKVYAGRVNEATVNIQKNEIANNAYNQPEVDRLTHDMIGARIKDAMLKGGGPELMQEARRGAIQDSFKAQLDALAVKDPKFALALLDKNKQNAGVLYDNMYASYKARAEQQGGDALMARSIGGASAAGPPLRAVAAGLRDDARTSLQNQGIPLQLTSETRSAAYNASVGGAHDSQHVHANAFDVSLNGLTPEQKQVVVSQFLNDPRTGGFGYYPASDSIHIDARPGAVRAAWGADYHNGSVGRGWPGWMTNQVMAWQAGDQGGGVQPASALGAATAGAFKSEAVRHAIDEYESGNVSPEEFAHGMRGISTYYQAQEIAENQSIKARKDLNDQAAGEHLTGIFDMMHTPNPDYVSAAGAINRDQRLDWKTKEQLMDRVKRMSGEEQALAYGPGYLAAREGLFSAPDAPGHVADFSSLVTRNDITTAGLADLQKRFQIAKGSVDRTAYEKQINSFISYAKNKLSNEQDVGPVKIRDPEGELIYSGTFVPTFVRQASRLMEEGEKTGNYEKLDKYLSRENVDKITAQMRDPRKMAAQRIAAGIETSPEAAGAPLPPAPEGTNEEGWRGLMSATLPKAGNGQPLSHEGWGWVIESLIRNPSEEVQQSFDRRYGSQGVKAKDVLLKLGINPEAAAAVAAVAPASGQQAAAPASPPAPAPAGVAPPTAPPKTEAELHPEAPDPRAQRRAERAAEQAGVEEQQRKESEQSAAERAAGVKESEAARSSYEHRLGVEQGHRAARAVAEPERRAESGRQNQIDVLKQRERALLGKPGDVITPAIKRELEKTRAELKDLEK